MRPIAMRSRGSCVLITAFLTLVLCTIPMHAADVPLAATVTAEEVEVRNVTPRGDVAFLWASVDSVHGFPREATGATQISDDDGDGIIRLTPDRNIPTLSIFIAVDVESGRHVIAAPDDRAIPTMEFPMSQTGREIVQSLAEQQARVELLVVRPREGGWRLRDIGRPPVEAKRRFGRGLSANSGHASALAGENEVPEEFADGDVVAIIDAIRMQAYVTEIGQ